MLTEYQYVLLSVSVLYYNYLLLFNINFKIKKCIYDISYHLYIYIGLLIKYLIESCYNMMPLCIRM